MWFIIFCVLAASCSNVLSSMTDQEVKVCFTKLVMKCIITNPVEMSELMNLQMMQVPTKMETKCLLACAYKADGALNATGFYDTEHALKTAEKIGGDDQTRVENGKKIVGICSKINEEAVTDGEKGCDRAGLMFKCLLHNAPKFGFKL